MKKIHTIKHIGQVLSAIAFSLTFTSCDSGSDSSSNTTNTIDQTPNSNADESYTITVDFVSGGGLGYQVGDTVLIQRTANSIIIGDKSYSPYEEFLNSSEIGQYTFDFGDSLLGVVSIGRSAKFILVSNGGAQFRGKF